MDADAQNPLPARPAAAPLEEDLFCLGCGYNLRGLSGVMVRCPECGEDNDVHELHVPAETIQQALNRMESAPTTCVAWAGFGATAAVAVALSLTKPGWATLIFCGLVGVAAMGWLGAARWARRTFEESPGWKRTLFEFHLATALCGLILPGLLIAVVVDFRWGRGIQMFAAVWLIEIPAAVVGLIIYASARRRLRIQQRDTAVRIGREMLRRARRRQPRFT